MVIVSKPNPKVTALVRAVQNRVPKVHVLGVENTPEGGLSVRWQPKTGGNSPSFPTSFKASDKPEKVVNRLLRDYERVHGDQASNVNGKAVLAQLHGTRLAQPVIVASKPSSIELTIGGRKRTVDVGFPVHQVTLHTDLNRALETQGAWPQNERGVAVKSRVPALVSAVGIEKNRIHLAFVNAETGKLLSTENVAGVAVT